MCPTACRSKAGKPMSGRGGLRRRNQLNAAVFGIFEDFHDNDQHDQDCGGGGEQLPKSGIDRPFVMSAVHVAVVCVEIASGYHFHLFEGYAGLDQPFRFRENVGLPTLMLFEGHRAFGYSILCLLVKPHPLTCRVPDAVGKAGDSAETCVRRHI
jgi:hypothetical protein